MYLLYELRLNENLLTDTLIINRNIIDSSSIFLLCYHNGFVIEKIITPPVADAEIVYKNFIKRFI
jgi:hypothetical protein